VVTAGEVLRMANSGPDTNKSHYFITYPSRRHLDKKHSVFGSLIGGIPTLDADQGGGRRHPGLVNPSGWSKSLACVYSTQLPFIIIYTSRKKPTVARSSRLADTRGVRHTSSTSKREAHTLATASPVTPSRSGSLVRSGGLLPSSACGSSGYRFVAAGCM